MIIALHQQSSAKILPAVAQFSPSSHPRQKRLPARHARDHFRLSSAGVAMCFDLRTRRRWDVQRIERGNSFVCRSYAKCTCKYFRIRSYEKMPGVGVAFLFLHRQPFAANNPLSAVFAITSGLFVSFLKLKRFVFNKIQPLFAKHPGGVPVAQTFLPMLPRAVWHPELASGRPRVYSTSATIFQSQREELICPSTNTFAMNAIPASSAS